MLIKQVPLKGFLLCFVCCFPIMFFTYAQYPDSLATGHLLDAAEEYWPVPADSFITTGFIDRIKHTPVNHNRGFNSAGIVFRETYEKFHNYLWGIGAQDKDGFLLHRMLFHDDLRLNRNLRFFAEVQSSIISGRNGGARPVQDRNDLNINQLFCQISRPVGRTTVVHLRVGKQSLNYGSGTLLDARDANVRRSFIGCKLILEGRLTKIDFFLMELAGTKQGIFDDKIDHSQKAAGVWATRKISGTGSVKLDFYYVLIKRNSTKFNQGVGKELRNIVGSGINFRSGNWSGYSEMDLQWGRFSNGSVFAWKLASSLLFQLQRLLFKPVLSVQAAISSGDKNKDDPSLQTFNPLYPKAVFYGFIDNAGSANIIVVHPKVDLQFTKRLRITVGHYNLWRQHSGDGIYAVNGSFLLPASPGSRNIGSMLDASAVYIITDGCLFQLIGSSYWRGKYLKQQSITKGNIHYLGFRTTLRI